MAQSGLDRQVDAFRQFNRFFTQKIGVLDEGMYRTPFSLAEVRVLYELANCAVPPTATDLARDLGLDPGYLSRLITGLRKKGLIDRQRSTTDGRQHHLALTKAGQAAYAPMEQASVDLVSAMIARLAPGDRGAVIEAMGRIQKLLGGPDRPAPVPYILRDPEIGDMGWIVSRQAVLYAEEYGWDNTFEALVAEIVAAYIRNYDPKWERCWIAEKDGVPVGSVFLVRQSDTVGKLRLLYVERTAQGLGIGRRLVDECIRHARRVGYRTLTLWTNDVLVPARRIYETAGFVLKEREPHRSFSKDLVGENWDLDLR